MGEDGFGGGGGCICIFFFLVISGLFLVSRWVFF